MFRPIADHHIVRLIHKFNPENQKIGQGYFDKLTHGMIVVRVEFCLSYTSITYHTTLGMQRLEYPSRKYKKFFGFYFFHFRKPSTGIRPGLFFSRLLNVD
jgi:hypothetical protein